MRQKIAGGREAPVGVIELSRFLVVRQGIDATGGQGVVLACRWSGGIAKRGRRSRRDVGLG
jgi:hypothetical protein